MKKSTSLQLEPLENMEHPEGNDVIGLQYGTNKHASQAGSGGFGSIRQIRNGLLLKLYYNLMINNLF